MCRERERESTIDHIKAKLNYMKENGIVVSCEIDVVEQGKEKKEFN